MAATRNLQVVYPDDSEPTTSKPASCPPAFLEYIWYVSFIYGMLGQVWGIVIPLVGGAILVLLAASCFLNVGGQALRVYKPVAWAFCTGALVIAIQLLFHQGTQQALTEGIAFVEWLALLIIVQSLSLRPRFLQRFALVAFAIGLVTLPYVNLSSGAEGVVRAGASGTGMSNANALALWFGFCTVYFLFWGLQSQKLIARAASWIVAVGCFYIVAITVSRGPLLAIVLACIVGFRSSLKQSFVPLLSLVLVMCLVYISGVFDEEIGYYTARGAEESGRGKLWPLALERILDSPWTGVGMGDFRIPYGPNRYVPPHNAFLRITLEAGIVPLICFLGYLARVVIGALRIMQRVPVGEAALLPPLVAFALFEMMVLDMVFMSPWTVVVFSLAAGAGQADAHQRSMS